MTDAPSPEEVARWQRRFAAQANNRAWRLSEAQTRTPEEDEEMLQAAHASMYFWKVVGTPGNRAHAAQLLAHVYALLKLPNPARYYFAQSEPFFLAQDCEPWEKACAYAVKASVAAAAGDAQAHASSYREAERLIAALPDPEDREILLATLRIVPKPDGTPVAAQAAAPAHATFRVGERVRKKSGAAWQGLVVGWYCTKLTPEGYAVESESHPGSVQIYPVAALERVGT